MRTGRKHTVTFSIRVRKLRIAVDKWGGGRGQETEISDKK